MYGLLSEVPAVTTIPIDEQMETVPAGLEGIHWGILTYMSRSQYEAWQLKMRRQG